MGIYGESLSLVTEGKILNKIKKSFIKFRDKKVKQYKAISDKRPESEKFFSEMEFKGHLEYYKKYYKNNFNTIFNKIEPETSEKYLKDIENIFGTSDINKIASECEKYCNKRGYKYTVQDDDNIIDDSNFVFSVHIQVVLKNMDKYEKTNGNQTGSVYHTAVLLQSNLFMIFNTIFELYFTDRANLLDDYANYKSDKIVLIGGNR